jgi:branched-chain amino acid transport system permease protein
LNGLAGISFIPRLGDSGNSLSPSEYQWFFLLLVTGIAVVCYFIVRAIHRAPYGRVLRSMRDDEMASRALGRNVNRVRMQIFIVGGLLGGLSGGLLAYYVGAWAPGSWDYPETFLFFTAIIVGGSGNLLGGVFGAALVPVGLLEATRFLPQIGYAGLVDSLSWVVIGLVLLVFLWFRPQGVFAERRRLYLLDERPGGVGSWLRRVGRPEMSTQPTKETA